MNVPPPLSLYINVNNNNNNSDNYSYSCVFKYHTKLLFFLKKLGLIKRWRYHGIPFSELKTGDNSNKCWWNILRFRWRRRKCINNNKWPENHLTRRKTIKIFKTTCCHLRQTSLICYTHNKRLCLWINLPWICLYMIL